MNDEELFKVSPFKRDYLNEVGSKIREYRKNKYVTQENLGALIGVQKAQVCKIESGKNLTIDTVTKVFDALDAKISIKIESEYTQSQYRQKIEHVVSCVSLFSELFVLTHRQAYNYLYRYGGIDFLDSYFESNSSFLPEIAVNKMYMVCKKNGGGL